MVLKEIPFWNEYTLRYDWDSYEKLCEALGVESFADFDIVLRRLGPKQLRILLWAGFLHKFPDMQPGEVGKIMSEFMDGKSIADITTPISEGLKAAGFIAERGNDPGEQPPKIKPHKS